MSFPEMFPSGARMTASAMTLATQLGDPLPAASETNAISFFDMQNSCFCCSTCMVLGEKAHIGKEILPVRAFLFLIVIAILIKAPKKARKTANN